MNEEISKYLAQKKKMEGICDENNLTFRFRRDTYPITLTVRPISDMYTQMSMLENVEEQGYISPGAYLMFEYKDAEVNHKMSGSFTISDALLAKLRNIFKKMHYYWLQYFFRNVIERKLLSPAIMPQIDEDDADDTDVLPDSAEPLEEFADELGEFDIDVSEDVKAAISIVRMENKASTSLLQRRMNISENRAIEIIEMLETMGVVGPHNENDAREVLPYDEPADDIESEENTDDAEDGVDNE